MNEVVDKGEAITGLSRPQVQIVQTSLDTLSFVATHFLEILRQIAVPVIAGWVILYFSLSAYISELLQFIQRPGDRSASLVLGVFTAGLLLGLLFNAIAVIGIARFAIGDRPSGYIRLGRPEWRFFAASLRFLLVSVGLIAVYLVGLLGISALNAGADVRILLGASITIAFLYLGVRVGSLMAPVTVAEKGAILRRAWRLSRLSQWYVAAVFAILAVPLFLIEIGGEFVLRLTGSNFANVPNDTLAERAVIFRRMLPEFLLVQMIAYVMTVVLFTVGSVYVYRKLAARPSA